MSDEVKEPTGTPEVNSEVEGQGSTPPVETTPVDTAPVEPQVKQNPYAQLQELGSPEEIAEFVQRYKDNQYASLVSEDEGAQKILDAYSSGKLADYIRVSSADYGSMSDEDVFREKIRREYPDATPKVIEYQLKQNLQKYMPEDEDDDNADVKQELMRSAANRLRAEFEKEKSEFELPSYKAPERNAPETPQVPTLEERIAALKGEKPIQQLYESKLIPTKVGDDVFNHEVDPDDIVERTADLSKLFAKGYGPDGKLDYNYAAKIAEFAKDPEAYEARLVSWAKGIGLKEGVDKMDNPAPSAGKVVKTPVRTGNAPSTEALWQAVKDGKVRVINT